MRNKDVGTLSYNAASRRMWVAYPDRTLDLHCGDYFKVLIDGKWVDTRIEMRWPGREYYLVDIPDRDLFGMRVRVT